MKKFLLYIFIMLAPMFAVAQETRSLEIDESSFAPVHTDVLTGVAIDKIEPDYSQRPCARIKLHINRMSREDINGISVKVIGGNVVVMKRVVAAEGNGLIIELTAKTETRFYLHHDKYGDSNQVTLCLEENKEYRLNAELKLFQSVAIISNVAGAEVYIDNIFKGRTDEKFTLTVNDMMHGLHKLRVVYGSDKRERQIEINAKNIVFYQNFHIEQTKAQTVVFKVEPKGATVTIAGKIISPYRDEYITSLEDGSYDYKVSADEYRTEQGYFVVSGRELRKYISLRPAFGWLKVGANGALGGAKVYLNNRYIGKAPLTTDKLPSGRYGVKIVKELYHEHKDSILIEDGKYLNYTPILAPNFADVEIEAEEGSAIYVNGVYKGSSSWEGRLISGSYTFEARKDRHKSTSIKQDIAPSPSCQRYKLPAPTPIIGTLNVESTPSAADVYVDDKLVGTTPLKHDLIIGNHSVAIRKIGYDDEIRKVAIEEDKTTSLNLQLMANAATVSVRVAEGFDIYIDNEFKAKTEWNGALKTGEHTFEARKEGYRTTSITRRVVSIPSHHDIQLETPTPMWGAISVGGVPVRADVYIDGAHVGRTPLKMPMLAGKHKVEVRNNSYRDYYLCDLNINEGQTRKLYSPLEKRDGYKGFESVAEFTSMVGCRNQYKYVGVNYVAGYRFNPYLYLGGGTGILYNHVKKNWGEDLSHGLPYEPYEPYESWCDSFNLNKVSIPVFAYWKLNFSDTNWSPFFVLMGGGYLSSKRTLIFETGAGLYKTSGLFINPQLGLDIRSRANIYFHFAFGFQCFGAPYCVDIEPYYAVVKQEDAWGLDFHVGITF